MKVSSIDFEDFADSREILEANEPNFIAIFIYFVVALFLAVFLWVWLGEIEIIINAKGVVRPASNISTVRSVIGGNLERINYREGQTVTAGELLFKIDTTLLESQKNNCLQKKSLLQETVRFLNRFETAVSYGAYPLSAGESNYQNRFLAYQYKYQQLSSLALKAKNTYQTEEKLGVEGTTPNRLAELKLEADSAETNLNQFKSETLANLKTELQDYQEQILQLDNELLEVEDKIRQSQAKAPISGVVQTVQKYNPGDYVTAGSELIKIIPDTNSTLRMELVVQNQDIGNLKIGQKTKYRFPALPYQEYGIVSGKIITLAKDTQTQNNELIYYGEASLDQTQLCDRKGHAAAIKAGMSSEVEIVTRKTKLLYWLLNKLDFNF